MRLDHSAPTALRDRTRWHLGANAPVAAWLAALVAITLFHRQVPGSPWLVVHLLLLGAVTNAIFVWSSHFADALLRRRVTAGSRRWQACRLLALNVGIVTVVSGMVSALWVLTLVGSVVVGAAATAHAITLALLARAALPSRFGATVPRGPSAAFGRKKWPVLRVAGSSAAFGRKKWPVLQVAGVVCPRLAGRSAPPPTEPVARSLLAYDH